MYEVGYFDGDLGQLFQPLRSFENEDDAREYVDRNYIRDELGQPQNIAIMHKGHIILDGRWLSLN